MSPFLQKFLLKLGKVGSFIFMIFFMAMPFAILNLPIWLEFIVFMLSWFISFIMPIVWIVGFIWALSGPQNILTIIYYVLFAVFFVIPFIHDSFKRID